MIITFDKNAVEKLAVITENGTAHHVPYTGGSWETPEDNTPGLILVGDEGVYFLSNAGNLEKDGIGKLPLAYAHECNPDELDADTVWDNKRASFGDDDGCEFFPLDEIRQWLASESGETMQLAITSKAIRLLATG